MRRNDIIAVLTLSVVIALGVLAVGASAFNSSDAGPRRYPPRGGAAIAAASQLSSPGHLSGPGHIGPPGQISPPGHLSGPGHIGPPGQVSPPGHLSGPGHVGPPGQLSGPGHVGGSCASNDGFESGSAGSNAIPCWTVVDEAGGSGSWCLQTGPDLPQGACAGDTTSALPPPEGLQAAMTNQSGPGSHVLYRCGMLRDATIGFDLYLDNAAEVFVNGGSLSSFGEANQQFRADLVDARAMAANPFTVAPADILVALYQTQPGDATHPGYVRVAQDASAQLHRSVCLRFVEVDNLFFFHAGIDGVQVTLASPGGQAP